MRFNTLILLITFVLFTFICCSENGSEQQDSKINIEIGNYLFNFPSEFKLIEKQGIDSYIGNIVGSKISLYFDFGWYTSASQNLPQEQYNVIEDEIEGHFRQIVIPINTKLGYTKIHLYKISDSLKSPFGYNSLTIATNNLTLEQQEIIIEVFNSVKTIE